MGYIGIYERPVPVTEKHEGAGTGLDLTVEDVLAEALGILVPPEPYYELHGNPATGRSLDAGEVMTDVEEILKAAEIIEALNVYLEERWAAVRETAADTEDEPAG